MKKIISMLACCLTLVVSAQCYWQQHIDYQMNVNVDVSRFQYEASQTITYKNNSPDALDYVFYHLQYNAFQPNSEMDIRLQTITDPDLRMVTNVGTKENPIFRSKIMDLKKEEQGFIEIKSLLQNGEKVDYQVIGTILKVKLNQPITPNGTAIFTMNYKAQIPKMVRRTGRNSVDNVALSMTQWFPKMAEYDVNGWHTSQYIMREFHGVWGNFDVKITLDKNYIVAGTGVLQNANEIGFGYSSEKSGVPTSSKTRTWHFKAENLHDFAWAADPDYKHDVLTNSNGKKLRFFYKNNDENWQKIQPFLLKVFDFFNEKIGSYPWQSYSFIQGGDGGMEYAMCTLLAGGKNYDALLRTAVHELGHAWFQHIFASDELTHPWFDEGFTSHIEDWAFSEVIENQKDKHAWLDAYEGYRKLVTSGLDEVPTTHADRYEKNRSYSIISYHKGNVFLAQLGYIIGKENLLRTFQQFYKNFGMKHPVPQDFIRTAEKVSKMQLGWYLNEFMQTTHTIDYSIEKVEKKDKKTRITLKRIGRIGMPIDLKINGENYHIPTALTLNTRPLQKDEKELPAWGWAFPTYSFEVDIPLAKIEKIQIDPNGYLADIELTNNIYLK